MWSPSSWSRGAQPSPQLDSDPALANQPAEPSRFAHHLGMMSIYAREGGTSTNFVQRCGATPCGCSPEQRVQRAGESAAEVGPEGGPLDDALAGRIEASRGGGTSLDAGLRVPMERSFGHHFGDVRVHADEEADTLNRRLSAAAFTTGSDLFFRQGTYQPGSGATQRLLAHELTHVVQQRHESVSGPMTVGPTGDTFEREADAVADRAGGRQHDGTTGSRSPAEQHWLSADRGPRVQRQAEGEPDALGLPDIPAPDLDPLGKGGRKTGKPLPQSGSFRAESGITRLPDKPGDFCIKKDNFQVTMNATWKEQDPDKRPIDPKKPTFKATVAGLNGTHQSDALTPDGTDQTMRRQFITPGDYWINIGPETIVELGRVLDGAFKIE